MKAGKHIRSRSGSLWLPGASFVLSLVLGLGLVGGVVMDRLAFISFLPPHATTDFRLMSQAWKTIEQNYVARADVKPRDLTYGAIGGMVDALDDNGHSRFLTPALVKEVHDFAKARFQGIGAEVQMKDGHVVIVAPIDGTPAQRAGLRPNDIILKVDGQDVTGLPLDQVVTRIAGPAGSSVRLTILTPRSGRTRDVALTRAAIHLHSVTWQRVPGTSVAHLHISNFNRDVTPDLEKALQEIRQQHLVGTILDLRDNPGGLLDDAVSTASRFLANGNVLLEKDATGKITAVPVEKGHQANNLPMVVLINNGSASAAEIVAGALKDAHRATLVGETTFGAGTVLDEFPLSDGSALLLAIREWLTPSGRVIWHKGVPPDVAVSLPANAEPLFPEAERTMSAAQFRANQDAQLKRALELLTSAPRGRWT